MSIRAVQNIIKARPTMEGAGVRLHRAFGGPDTGTDPFLLFDDFRGDDPRHYQAGFPWHPHRGIETITYVLAGEVTHQDSLGNKGTIGPGDVQWMTAGSGIIHQEMPEGDTAGRMHGFQLWANLPSYNKMTDPRYQEIPSGGVPEIGEEDGTLVRVITGVYADRRGPVEGIAGNPSYLDIFVPPGRTRTFRVETTHNAFAYIFEGSGAFRGASSPQAAMTEYVDESGIGEAVPSHPVENRHLVLFDRGDEVRVTAGAQGIRFLLVSGAPLQEPVAWHGPIVMNTEEELELAFRELQEGSFLRKRGQ